MTRRGILKALLSAPIVPSMQHVAPCTDQVFKMDSPVMSFDIGLEGGEETRLAVMKLMSDGMAADLEYAMIGHYFYEPQTHTQAAIKFSGDYPLCWHRPEDDLPSIESVLLDSLARGEALHPRLFHPREVPNGVGDREPCTSSD